MSPLMAARNKIKSMKRFIYCPQIPTGKARTRGYGRTVAVYVIEAGENFKTLNSKHKVLRYFGTVRTDYGLVRGHSARVLDAAEQFCRMVQLPEARTTVNEF